MMANAPVKLWDKWNASGGPKYPHEKVVQFILRRFPSRVARECATVLDLGCGSGVHTLFLALEGFDTYATDISPVGVSNTLTRLKLSGLQAAVAEGSAQSINHPDSSFDSLICIGVLECLEPSAFPMAMREIVRVLKPHGCALLVFASEVDFRVVEQKVPGLFGRRMCEVEEALLPVRNDLEKCWFDRYVTSYENQRIQQNDHLVTLVRRGV
jgi:ubiquinone/menaquinone biosynthesis C-methylase UbiE